MAKPKNKAPAFQYYPDKFESHTAHLSDYAYRVYHRLIGWMWLHSSDKCSIKAEDSVVALMLAQPIDKISEAMKEIQNEHMPLLKNVRGKWVSNGLKKEASKQKERRKKAQDSAKARWGKDLDTKKEVCERNANASPKQCSPSPSPSPSLPIDSTSKDVHNRKKRKLTEAQKKRIRVDANTDPMIRINSWFGKKPTTLWNLYDADSLSELGELDPDCMDKLEYFYTASISKGDDWRRTTISTLLNNWDAEIDKANKYHNDNNTTDTGDDISQLKF
jgi:hypothetical protein